MATGTILGSIGDQKFGKASALTHTFTFPASSSNILLVDGNGSSRQYAAFVYCSSSVTVFELAKGSGVTVSTSGNTLTLTLNAQMPVHCRVVNINGSSAIT